MTAHIPVLANEVIAGLALKPGDVVLDGTLGLGGHAALMLEAIAPSGTLIGVERDARNLALATARLAAYGDNVRTIRDSFANIAAHNVSGLDAALLDLGFSSVHVDDASRGFSFMHDGPLDMRYDLSQTLMAEAIVNSWSREDIGRLLREYGEEPHASGIAKAITDARKKERITTTGQLAALVSSLAGRRGRIHPATRTFQALRIAVNDELGELTRGLRVITDALKPGGRFAVITFHSLEDRVVKQFFKGEEGMLPLTKRPVIASDEETRTNPRARSAKLRIAQKV